MRIVRHLHLKCKGAFNVRDYFCRFRLLKGSWRKQDQVVGAAVVIQVLEAVLSDRLGAKTQRITGMDLELISDKKNVPSFLPSFPS